MNIDRISRAINEDPDDYNEQAEDLATRLRRYLVRHHSLEEYDIHINTTPEEQEYGNIDQEVWKMRHNMLHKPFVLAIRRDILARRETALILQNVKRFLATLDWKVSKSEVGPDEFEITVSPK